jgi:hypothetical protein
MKTFLTLFLLAMTAAASASAADMSNAPRLARGPVATTEKNLDNRFTRLWSDNPVPVLGPSRGVYLEGYGIVFTTEVNVVAGPPLTLFNPPITKEYAAQHKQAKMKRIPELRAELQKALLDVAASKEMATVPPDEQIVLVAYLSHFPWEDLSGIPAQIMLQGSKKKLLEAKSSGANLETAMQATQF